VFGWPVLAIWGCLLSHLLRFVLINVWIHEVAFNASRFFFHVIWILWGFQTDQTLCFLAPPLFSALAPRPAACFPQLQSLPLQHPHHPLCQNPSSNPSKTCPHSP